MASRLHFKANREECSIANMDLFPPSPSVTPFSSSSVVISQNIILLEQSAAIRTKFLSVPSAAMLYFYRNQSTITSRGNEFEKCRSIPAAPPTGRRLAVAAHMTHRVLRHHLRVVDDAHQVDDGDRRVEHVGAEEVLVQGDPLAAEAPAHNTTPSHRTPAAHSVARQHTIQSVTAAKIQSTTQCYVTSINMLCFL